VGDELMNSSQQPFMCANAGPSLPTSDNPTKLVPLKRGLWLRLNLERWRDMPMTQSLIVFQIYFQPFVFAVVILNFTLSLFTIDPSGPPVTFHEGKWWGLARD
jgi:hypothetical protein